MEVPIVDKLIEFVKKCPFDKYSVTPTGISKKDNYASILNVYINNYRKSEPVYEIIMNGVDVTEYYSRNDYLRLKEAIQETNKKYEEYLINNFVFEDLEPVIEAHNVEDLDGFV